MTLNVEIEGLIMNSTLPPTNSVAWASLLTTKFHLYSKDELSIAIYTSQGCYEHQIGKSVKATNAEVTQ